MITAYIWGAGASGKGFAFWGWAEKEPRSSRAPHIVCGWATPKAEAPRLRYLVSQTFEAPKVADAPWQYKAHIDSMPAAKNSVMGKRAGKSAASAAKAVINESCNESAAKIISSKIKNTGTQTDKVFKITNN